LTVVFASDSEAISLLTTGLPQASPSQWH